MSGHTLYVLIGGVSKKPIVIDNEIVIREMVCVTFSVDHDIVDGVPAVKFGLRFKELFESGYGLNID